MYIYIYIYMYMFYSQLCITRASLLDRSGDLYHFCCAHIFSAHITVETSCAQLLVIACHLYGMFMTVYDTSDKMHCWSRCLGCGSGVWRVGSQWSQKSGISRIRFSPFYTLFLDSPINLCFYNICVVVSSNRGPLTIYVKQYPWNPLRRVWAMMRPIHVIRAGKSGGSKRAGSYL